MLKGAIFDLDGTLLDSMFIWDTFGEDYLKTLGIQPKENLRETFRTFTLEQAAAYYRAHYGVTLTVKEIVDDINTMVAEMYRARVTLKPGVKAFLERLYKSGVKMCVATVTDRPVAEDILRRLGVAGYFSGIFTCAEVGYDKTSPHIYRKALEFLGTEKKETVVFEDALYAVKTAKEDGFTAIAVYDEHEPMQKELQEISDDYIKDFGDFCLKTKVKTVLTIAGSDSSGGAGIQADIKTITMHGLYAMSAITALTAQNTLGVHSILETSPEFLKKQLDAVFEDIYPDSVKIGMVASSELIKVIADRLLFYQARNIVVDPVMVATSGSKLIKNDAVKTLCTHLLPVATIITPNIPEAEVLSGLTIKNKADMLAAAKILHKTYGCAVLVKGGHSINDASDLLYENDDALWFEGVRIPNPNTHGTGCTLSSSIASHLAKGLPLPSAVKKAKAYISDALSAGLDLGHGSGPLLHNFILYKNAFQCESGFFSENT